MTKVTLALDWTPNTNHTGVYVALAKGWYGEHGVEVEVVSPHEDGYASTPGQRLAAGDAHFAVAPSETVISSHTPPAATPLVALAAILQSDTSAIVTLKSSGLDRPRLLDGRRYASYGARYEGRIVQQLIRGDGGEGTFQEATPPKLGIFDCLLKGEADATWVFMGWEGVEASRRRVGLHAFSLEDHGIPYGYSPLLVATRAFVAANEELVGRFMRATARGFAFAAAHPEEAADLLVQSVAQRAAAAAPGGPAPPPPLDPAMVRESQALVSRLYLDEEGRWGRQRAERWDAFLDWLSGAGLLTALRASRAPQGGVSASLDALRGGGAGEAVPRSAFRAEALFDNRFLLEG